MVALSHMEMSKLQFCVRALHYWWWLDFSPCPASLRCFLSKSIWGILGTLVQMPYE